MGMFFIDPNDEEFKFAIKAARRKLEVPMSLHRNIGKRKTKYSCVVDADERTRPRLEGAGHKLHQDHMTAKGTTSITHFSLVHKFIPMPQASKNPDAKAAMDKEWKNWRKSWHDS